MKQQKIAYTQYSRLAASWAGSGNGNAPSADFFIEGAIGADTDGVAASLTYHVVDVAGTKSWVPTGATVKNLYGGA